MRGKWRQILRERRFLPLWLLLAAVLLAGGGLLRHGAAEKREEAERLALSCRTWEEAAALPEESRGFPPSFFSRGRPASLSAALADGGLSLTRLSETTEAADGGGFHRIRMAGHGSFAQIFSAFDIIHREDGWNRVDLLSLKREGRGLAFEMEVTTFQIRSTNEEEKYSPHRANGDGEEQSRQDYR